MIRVNWTEVKQLDEILQRTKWKPDSVIEFDITYCKPGEDKASQASIKVPIHEWLSNLFKIESQSRVTAVVVKDPRKRVIWKVQEQPLVTEEIPASGHDHVVEGFAALEPIQKQVWTQIAEAQMLDYMASEV